MDFRDVIEHRVKARGTINQVKGGSSGNSVNAISFLDLGSTKALCQVAFSSNGFDILQGPKVWLYGSRVGIVYTVS